jgi:hypothetical protein
MTFDERRDRALALMARTPVPRRRYAPPVFEFFWRLGIQAPPPHFGGGWFWQLSNVLVIAIAVMPASAIRGGGLGTWFVGLVAVGLVTATVVARGYARDAERLELPSWEDLNGDVTGRGSILGLEHPVRPDRDR